MQVDHFHVTSKAWESSQGLQQMRELWTWVRSRCFGVVFFFFLLNVSLKIFFWLRCLVVPILDK